MEKRNGTERKEGKVKVVVRCRPRNTKDKLSKDTNILCAANTVSIQGRVSSHLKKTFTFDHVYDHKATQGDIYDTTVSPIVKEVLEGYNCTVFAYGQTGTGKTYTMEGGSFETISTTATMGNGLVFDTFGVIPRAVQEIFRHLEKSKVEYNVRVSHLEIYNEELMDLLSTKSSTDDKLKLCQGDHRNSGNVTVTNLEEVHVLNASDIFRVLARGQYRRQVAETKLNNHSSRSHCIFTIKIRIKENNVATGEECVKIGKLNLVDLAGSENIGRSGAVGKHAREAGRINKSLLTLGKVITALTESHPHIPYRESKLTRLLQESLGGRAKTCIIATISPSCDCLEETTSTLEYAHRARNIQNRPQVNETVSKKVVMQEMQTELEHARQQLADQIQRNGVYMKEEEYNRFKDDLASLREMERILQASLESKERDVEELKRSLEGTFNDLKNTRNELAAKEGELTQKISELDETKEILSLETVKVEERDYLLLQHEDYEEKLKQETKSVSDSLDRATHHISGLEGKVTRQEGVLQENKQEGERFRSLLSKQLDKIHDEVCEDHSHQAQFQRELQDGFKKIGEQAGQDAQKVKGNIHQLLDSLSKSRDAILLSEADSIHGLGEGMKENLNQSDKFFQESQTSSLTHTAKCAETLGSLEQSLMGTLASVESWCSSADSLATQHIELLSQTSKNQMERMEKIQSQLRSLSQSCTHNAEQTSFLVEEMAKKQERETEEMVKSMQLLLNSFVEKQKKSLSYSVDGLKEAMSLHVVGQQQVFEQASGNVGECLQEMSSFENSSLQTKQAMSDGMESHRIEIKDSVIQGKHSLSQLGGSIESHHIERKEREDSHSSEMQQKMSLLQEQFEGQSAKREREMKEMWGEKDEEALDMCVEEMCESVMGHCAERTEAISSHLESQDSDSSKIQEELQDAEMTAQKYEKNWKIYQTTGTTPKKTQYHIPEMSQIKPRDTLLQSYRNLKRSRDSPLSSSSDENEEKKESPVTATSTPPFAHGREPNPTPTPTRGRSAPSRKRVKKSPEDESSEKTLSSLKENGSKGKLDRSNSFLKKPATRKTALKNITNVGHN